MSQDQPEPHNDGLFDAIALTEAIRRDDETTVRSVEVVLRHCNSYDVALTLARLLAEVCKEQEVDPVHMRRWAADAVKRG